MLIKTLNLIIALSLSPFVTFAQDLTPIGEFTNVESSDGGEHCGGYSLSLWKQGDSMIGLLSEHVGLCGDPPCGFFKVPLDSANDNQLSFSALIMDSPKNFQGQIKAEQVEGELEGKKLILKKTSSPWMDSSVSKQEWCKKWSKIDRCIGLKSFCNQ